MFFIFSEIYHVFFILFRAMPPTPAPSMLETLQSLLDDLPAELQRAARWVAAHPAEVGLWSMRRQAQAVGVAPATMLRLARAAGCGSYEDFRAPFQQALTAA
ncbi:MurR/RpiR family transcriptional regulator, partial [Bordetella pertussis]